MGNKQSNPEKKTETPGVSPGVPALNSTKVDFTKPVGNVVATQPTVGGRRRKKSNRKRKNKNKTRHKR